MTFSTQTTTDLTKITEALDQRIYELTDGPTGAPVAAAEGEVEMLQNLCAQIARHTGG